MSRVLALPEENGLPLPEPSAAVTFSVPESLK